MNHYFVFLYIIFLLILIIIPKNIEKFENDILLNSTPYILRTTINDKVYYVSKKNELCNNLDCFGKLSLTDNILNALKITFEKTDVINEYKLKENIYYLGNCIEKCNIENLCLSKPLRFAHNFLLSKINDKYIIYDKENNKYLYNCENSGCILLCYNDTDKLYFDLI